MVTSQVVVQRAGWTSKFLSLKWPRTRFPLRTGATNLSLLKP
jgi:hypothetical protein